MLYEIPFTWIIDNDVNRAWSGVSLRRLYCIDNGISEYLHIDQVLETILGDCTLLEMLVALAKDCEDQITFNVEYGDRTGFWFWLHFIRNLFAGEMEYIHNEVASINREYIENVIDSFLNREYTPDGRHNIIYIPGENDIIDIEIWWQLNRYINFVYDNFGENDILMY